MRSDRAGRTGPMGAGGSTTSTVLLVSEVLLLLPTSCPARGEILPHRESIEQTGRQVSGQLIGEACCCLPWGADVDRFNIYLRLRGLP